MAKCKGKILVVDDDCLNRELIKEILNDYNYGIEEAENGKQAFEKISYIQSKNILFCFLCLKYQPHLK